MTVKVTISLDEKVKRTLSRLAHKNKNTVSAFISEMVKKESIRENISAGDQGLGSILRATHPVL